MNIVILAGGTGSIALQTGLWNALQNIEGVDIKVLVNAYDNGLSTGAVRRVTGGNILGPSDVRKNQTTRFALENPSSPFNGFLNLRFTSAPKDAHQYCLNKIDDLRKELTNLKHEGFSSKIETLKSAVNTYFAQTSATQIDYNDFSLSNIIYAGLAVECGNSLRKAATIMADVLGIKDNVLLNDDTSLFLGAIAANGDRITDEGDIVSWNNPNNPIVDVFFTNAHGEEAEPVLCSEAKQAIHEADVVILSSGTQWSSLIPTYASKGFKQAMASFKGKILMVMNKVPDKDAPSTGADDIVRQIVPRFFPENRIDLIMDAYGHSLMNSVKNETVEELLASASTFELSYVEQFSSWSETKHDPDKLAWAICKTIYKDFVEADTYVFDYDDTLVGRGNSYPLASSKNVELLSLLGSTKKVAVCTGNSIRSIRLEVPRYCSPKPIIVYADGGINEYVYNTKFRHTEDEGRAYTFVECLLPEVRLTKGITSTTNIISALCLSGIPAAKIENRGDVMLSIKPIDPEYREMVRNLASRVLDRTGLRVKSAGRTTIEIGRPEIEKSVAVKKLLAEMGDGKLVFVGDEFHLTGNDAPVAKLAITDKRVKCLSVKNPADTALFLYAATGKTHGG
jgi:2-phospho-L-lactate transferase/gluconeogenesis factor (CofD/UPF0052 family)/hydroxymethylpyrimidine pyrophosphatase-like HAD family hydrolase